MSIWHHVKTSVYTQRKGTLNQMLWTTNTTVDLKQATCMTHSFISHEVKDIDSTEQRNQFFYFLLPKKIIDRSLFCTFYFRELGFKSVPHWHDRPPAKSVSVWVKTHACRLGVMCSLLPLKPSCRAGPGKLRWERERRQQGQSADADMEVNKAQHKPTKLPS